MPMPGLEFNQLEEADLPIFLPNETNLIQQLLAVGG